MTEQYIKNINSKVGIDDTLYILGDVYMNKTTADNEIIFKTLSAINCKKVHIIVGNHDTYNKMTNYRIQNWDCKYADVLTYNNNIFYLSHYPTITANFDEPRPVYNLFGHTHQKELFYNDNPNMFHVGVDSNNGYPWSIKEIIREIHKKKAEINSK